MLRTKSFRIVIGRFLIAGIATLTAVSSNAWSQDPDPNSPVMRIEEDWELEIGTPDPDNDGPQIINVISPSGDIKGQHAVLELNHQSFPDFQLGGLQVQHWEGDTHVNFYNSSQISALNYDGESIRYTMSMSLSGGVLKYSVVNGKGHTWGSFGGDELSFQTKSPETSLDSYDSTVSKKYSRVSFASNRVKSFVLKEIRYFDAEGNLLKTDKPSSSTTN